MKNTQKVDAKQPEKVDFESLGKRLQEAKETLKEVQTAQETLVADIKAATGKAIEPFEKKLIALGLEVQIKVAPPRLTNGANRKYDYFLNGEKVALKDLKAAAATAGLIEATKSYKADFIVKKLSDNGVNASMKEREA